MARVIPRLNFEEQWAKIRVLLDRLEEFLDGKRVLKDNERLYAKQEFLECYGSVMTLCTQTGSPGYTTRFAQLHGECLETYFRNNIITAIKSARGISFLKEVLDVNTKFSIMNTWYAKFFNYLDQHHYVSSMKLRERGLMKFKSILFEGVKKELAEVLLDLINSERSGFVADEENMIGQCVTIFVDMDKLPPANTKLYENDFEKRFLDDARLVFNHKSRAWIQSESVSSYLKLVEDLITAESHRCNKFSVLPSTEKKLMDILNEEMIQVHVNDLLDRGCKNMFINEQISDLRRMYILFARVPNGLVCMAPFLTSHITELGNQKITAYETRIEGANAAAKESKEKEKDKEKETKEAGKAFINHLLELHKKYEQMVIQEFASQIYFQNALRDAFVRILNQEFGTDKMVTLLATYCDALLKGEEKMTDGEIEVLLEQLAKLVSFVTDKDIFVETYRVQLAKRLLNNKSASDEMERLMVGKLKRDYGNSFTVKLEGMFNDFNVSKDFSAQFKAFCESNPGLLSGDPSSPHVGKASGSNKIEFVPLLLTQGNWPQYTAYNSIHLPASIARCIEVFTEFHHSKIQMRKLNWIHSLGTVEVKGTFGKKSYTMNVAPLQAVVIMAFNSDALTGESSDGRVSFEAIQKYTNVDADPLKKVLFSLISKYKIITKHSEATADGKPSMAIKSTDSFSPNGDFKCPNLKFSIPLPIMDEKGAVKDIDENRVHVMEAGIVRIMKARKALGHQQLVGEVLHQLEFFKPTSKAIKQRIESLIEREYLERDPDAPNSYRYLA